MHEEMQGPLDKVVVLMQARLGIHLYLHEDCSRISDNVELLVMRAVEFTRLPRSSAKECRTLRSKFTASPAMVSPSSVDVSEQITTSPRCNFIQVIYVFTLLPNDTNNKLVD